MLPETGGFCFFGHVPLKLKMQEPFFKAINYMNWGSPIYFAPLASHSCTFGNPIRQCSTVITILRYFLCEDKYVADIFRGHCHFDDKNYGTTNGASQAKSNSSNCACLLIHSVFSQKRPGTFFYGIAVNCSYALARKKRKFKR